MHENSENLARFNMIHQQIRPWNVSDGRVLDVLREVPREAFVPAAYRGVAFADMEIPLPSGHSMMAPKLVAKLLQGLAIRPKDNILEIGTGSGYITACLAKLGGYVTSIDLDVDSIEAASKRLIGLGIRNVSLKVSDAMESIPGGSYDVIVVTGSLPQRIDRFEAALSIGGRLFAVIGQSPLMEACFITRLGERDWSCEPHFETDLAPLEHHLPAQSFIF